MVLGLRPENRCVGDEHHLVGIAAFRQHAEVDVADDTVTIVLPKVRGGDAVLQLFLADVGLTAHAFVSF